MQPTRRFALALLALVLTLPLAARDRSVRTVHPGGVLPSTVSGIVSSVSGSTITLANGAVTIDASAAVIATRSGAGSIASVVRGAKITATVNSDAAANAPLRATHVIVFDEPELTLSGPVQSVDRANRSFVILGRTVYVTDQTTFAGRTRDAGQVIDAIVTNNYLVAGVNITGGRLVADAIYGLPAPPSIPTMPTLTSFEGVVQTIETAQWVVLRESRPVTVKVTAQTIIAGNPRAGDRVRVITTTDAANGMTAVAITRAELPANAPQQLRWIHGTVLGTHPSSWTIQEKDKMIETSVEITSETKILMGAQTGMVVDVLVEVRNNRLIALLITRSMFR